MVKYYEIIDTSSIMRNCVNGCKGYLIKKFRNRYNKPDRTKKTNTFYKLNITDHAANCPNIKYTLILSVYFKHVKYLHNHSIIMG